MSLKSLAVLTAFLASAPAMAQDDWEYRATFYGWLTGVTTEAETPLGEFEAEIDFADIFDELDIAAFGAFEARKGRWSFIGDGMYVQLSPEISLPAQSPLSRGEIETQTGLISAYATYAVIDEADWRFDIGGGLRYYDASTDTTLIAQDGSTVGAFTSEGSWTDLLLAARATRTFNEKWWGIAYADIGGFGIEDSSELSWQVFGGFGYRLSDTWSAIAGYRYLSIERDVLNSSITADLYGPQIGVQVAF